jgi:hypothetical protein
MGNKRLFGRRNIKSIGFVLFVVQFVSRSAHLPALVPQVGQISSQRRFFNTLKWVIIAEFWCHG